MSKIISFIFCSFLFSALAQNGAYIYGGTNDDQGHCFATNELGGYVFVGSERTAIDSAEQISIVSIDGKGNLVWKHTYGDIHHEIPEHIERTTDNGFIVVSSTFDGGYSGMDYHVMKLNAEGTIEWEKFYGDYNRDDGFSIKETSDGGYIIAGFSKSEEIGSYGQMYVVKTDAAGNEIWNKYIGGPGKDYAFDAIETSTGEFIITGIYAGFYDYSTFEFTETHSDILIAKLDVNGNELWTNTYGGTDNELAFQAELAPDGGFYIIGSTQSAGAGSFDIYLLKIDTDGNQEWDATYGDVGFDYGRSIDLSKDNYLYITGTTNNDLVNNKTDIIVLKLDLNGNEIWSFTFGGDESEYGYFIRATDDNGCAVIGSTKSFGSGKEDMCFLKIDANGLLEPLIGSEENKVLIYPNPTLDTLNIYLLENNECFDYTYEIMDDQGRLVYDKDKTSKFVKIDVTSFGQGTYIYRITSPCFDELSGKFIVH